MTVTLVIPEVIGAELASAAAHPLETAGVLVVTLVQAGEPGDLRLLAREIVWVPDEHYRARNADGLAIASGGYVAALGRAADLSSVALWFHTHPGPAGRPSPSSKDAVVDLAIADLFRIRADTPWYGTLIMSSRPDGIAFTGQMLHEDGTAFPIDRLWQVGDRWRMIRSFNEARHKIDDAFDRNVRAFGPDIQDLLGDLRVAVVGAGGTGSAVCEQLVRLGVRHLDLFDVDRLSESNVTRVYGSTATDVGRPKVEVLRDPPHPHCSKPLLRGGSGDDYA